MATETKNLVEQTREQFQSRLDELQPMLDEAEQIRSLLGQLDTASGARRSGRGRRRAGNTRADEFVKLVRENPGITVADAAKQMGIGPNYLYRVAREQQEEGKLTKDGSGYKVVSNGKSNAKPNKAKEEKEAAASK